MLLAAAGTALGTMSASAATPTYNDQDALLGFRVLGGTGGGFEGIINLGSVSQFTMTSTFTLSLGDIGGFMTNNFGADWYTRLTGTKTSIQWAVVATDNQTGLTNDMWSTRNPAVRSTPWQIGDTSYASNGVYSVGQQYSNSSNSIAAGTTSAVKQSSTASNSWTSYQPGGPNSQTISFGYFNPTNEGNTSTVLAFDYVPFGSSGSGTTLGTFTWNSNGTVLWTGAAVAVPEPSTYGMMGLGALTLFGLMVLRRRRALRA